MNSNGAITASPNSEFVVWIDNDGYPESEDQFPYDHVSACVGRWVGGWVRLLVCVCVCVGGCGCGCV